MAAGDGDVGGAGGDDDGGGQPVVGGSDADAEVPAESDAAAVDGGGPRLGRGADGLVGWAALGGGGPHVGGEASTDRPVGAVVVVDQAEQVELGLQVLDRCGGWLLGEPFLEGLVNAFDLAAGLGVVGPGVASADPELGERVGEHMAERTGIVGQEPCRPAQHHGGRGHDGQRGGTGARHHRARGNEQT